jgi:hypothetical protein
MGLRSPGLICRLVLSLGMMGVGAGGSTPPPTPIPKCIAEVPSTLYLGVQLSLRTICDS